MTNSEKHLVFIAVVAGNGVGDIQRLLFDARTDTLAEVSEAGVVKPFLESGGEDRKGEDGIVTPRRDKSCSSRIVEQLISDDPKHIGNGFLAPRDGDIIGLVGYPVHCIPFTTEPPHLPKEGGSWCLFG